uniref:Uncharacterized protein n=1 Tax=Arundo donax TaxID=35708 RepID=A0A0A9EB28_ARUDO
MPIILSFSSHDDIWFVVYAKVKNAIQDNCFCACQPIALSIIEVKELLVVGET